VTGNQRDPSQTADLEPPARAFACLGPVSIAYSCSGRGKPVLLLVPGFSLRERLRERLADRFKVLAPEIGYRSGGIRGRLWLNGLIDTLGLARPQVVVAGPRVLEALTYGIAEPDQVDRIAILWRDPIVRTGPVLAPGGAPAGLSPPVLLLPLAAATPGNPIQPAEIEVLARFLG